MNARSAFAVSALAAGCAAAATPAPAPPVIAPPAATAVAPPAPVPASHSPPPAATTEPPLGMEWVQVLAVPVKAIALGDGTRIAALADPPYVGDARGLHPLALPPGLRPQPGELDQLGIYFGRDNEPRIMGKRQTQHGEAAIYFRHLQSGWRDGREEIGQLGGTTRGALWGVLGGSDPELVCRSGAVCIIKRQSGWTTVPAGTSQRIVTLQDGVLWGLDDSGVSSIDKQGWAVALPAPEWSAPEALWATQGEAWVSASGQLFHSVAGKWQAMPSPVGAVHSLWGARRDSIWFAGSAGAAHFDGQRLRALSIPGPLYVVRGRSDAELWFGGEAGLFRSQAPSAK